MISTIISILTEEFYQSKTYFRINSLTIDWCRISANPSGAVSSTVLVFDGWCCNLGPNTWTDSIPSSALPIRSSVTLSRFVTRLLLFWWSGKGFLPFWVVEPFVIFTTSRICSSNYSSCSFNLNWKYVLLSYKQVAKSNV